MNLGNQLSPFWWDKIQKEGKILRKTTKHEIAQQIGKSEHLETQNIFQQLKLKESSSPISNK